MKSKYQLFLDSSLKEFPKYKLTEEDEKAVLLNQKSQWILRKMVSKRFRKSTVVERTKQDILKKINLSLEKEIPIKLIVCFGGYKHFWNKSYPRVDWAEFFNLVFLAEYVAPILAVHRPGVVLDYESEDIILPLIDNYPEKDLDLYAKSFKDLIGFFLESAPQNLKINYVRSQNQIDTNKLLEEVKIKFPKVKEEWLKLSEEEKKYRLIRTPRNIMWDGKENLTNLNDEQKEDKLINSKIINELYYEIDFKYRGNYFTGDNHIPIVLSWGLCRENIDNWLTLGSTFASTTDFWSGRGILEDDMGELIPRVVSKKQYEALKENLISEKINGFNFNNFNEIEIYKGKINFDDEF